MENWQTHLRAAATLIPALMQLRMILITPGLASSSSGTGHHGRIVYLEDDSAVNLLLGSFIWFDIISCVSTRSGSFLDLDHKLFLETAKIHLEDLSGCRNWAIVSIFEISLLDRWKKEEEEAHILSVIELTRRGRQIEQRLEEKLTTVENTPSTRAAITRIFALSAITYLYVVVSGANPKLPEIISSVSKTIAAFQRLTDKRAIRSLVWPFCISGCLAQEEQYHIFRDLASAAEITESTVGTCLEALKIMEECWEARRICPYNYDWVSVMHKRGQYILLG